MNTRNKRRIAGVALCLSLSMAGGATSFALAGEAPVSPALEVIAGELSLAKAGLCGEEIAFEASDFSEALGVESVGAPLPQDSLQKLWDSFYRQDAARLRSEGHFGLGLSIVKAVQDAHSQQCGVDNAEGGIEFWFDVAKGSAPEEEKE